jgi:hypothetical protein
MRCPQSPPSVSRLRFAPSPYLFSATSHMASCISRKMSSTARSSFSLVSGVLILSQSGSEDATRFLAAERMSSRCCRWLVIKCVYMCVNASICMEMRLYMYKCIYIYICANAYICMHMRLYVCKCVYMCVNASICMKVRLLCVNGFICV